MSDPCASLMAYMFLITAFLGRRMVLSRAATLAPPDSSGNKDDFLPSTVFIRMLGSVTPGAQLPLLLPPRLKSWLTVYGSAVVVPLPPLVPMASIMPYELASEHWSDRSASITPAVRDSGYWQSTKRMRPEFPPLAAVVSMWNFWWAAAVLL